MALVEIDDGELALLHGQRDTIAKMLAHPDARKRVLEAQKLINPNLPIPEIDAAKPIMDAVCGMREEMAKFMKEQADREAEREKTEKMKTLQQRWDTGRGYAKGEGYTDDGLAALEKFMEERGIADHEDAIPAFERKHPPAPPAIPSAPGRFDIMQPETRKDEMMKMLFDGNEEAFLAQAVPQAIGEVRGAKR